MSSARPARTPDPGPLLRPASVADAPMLSQLVQAENLALYTRIGYVECDRIEHGPARLVYLCKQLES